MSKAQWPKIRARSYRWQDKSGVALMLGHTTTGLLFDHYKALATPQQAEQYWSIKPEQHNIVSFPATA